MLDNFIKTLCKHTATDRTPVTLYVYFVFDTQYTFIAKEIL